MKHFPGVDQARVALSQVRDVSLGELIRQEVLASILRGELSPGDRINEPDVAQRLGVSRVPVREALRALESSGLVISKKHAGVFVRHIEEREITELYQLRAAMDSMAGSLLVERMAQMPKAKQVMVLLDDLEASIVKMQAGNGQAYYRENLNFHWLIIEGAANKSACDMYQQVVQKLHISRIDNLSDEKSRAVSTREHKQILKAIRALDAQSASNALHTHVIDARQRSLLKRSASL
jgi:DNA-binding GntR family transcriptional regulator